MYMDTVTNKRQEPEQKLTCKVLCYSGTVYSCLGCHTLSLIVSSDGLLQVLLASYLISTLNFVSRQPRRSVVNILVIHWLPRNNKILKLAVPFGLLECLNSTVKCLGG